jgi:hypothetical protein
MLIELNSQEKADLINHKINFWQNLIDNGTGLIESLSKAGPEAKEKLSQALQDIEDRKAKIVALKQMLKDLTL